ncbi:MAG: glutamine synthetase III [Fusobacteria bacterium]|nr:glutamine synthetase III [Fusobacteriota bacterium]
MNIQEIYGKNVFTEEKVRERVPKGIFNEFKSIQKGNKKLSSEVADVISLAMRDWAIENGATHYTHWFQPLTEITAEKHDSFLAFTKENNATIMEFSGSNLIVGEPDASSFPSGGLRHTFEARGYTAWDLSSPAFLKEDATGVTLYIPTIFISYHGQALDKKLPMLRSMEVINKASLRVVKYFNIEAESVKPTVGAEQEYFLIDKSYVNLRKDLLLTGKTLFGSLKSTGSQVKEHYFAHIPERVGRFMKDFNEELWKLGVPAKTQHNEVAPCQFEIAPVFEVSNLAVDHNQLVMESLEKIASRHGFVALLHEKPFSNMNGSGKHNNWSLATEKGQNLLDPGKNPEERTRFLFFVSAILKATDIYAGILKASVSSAGNDLRLGGHEAPPSIISIFLGSELTQMLEDISQDKIIIEKHKEIISLGVNNIPDIPKDLTDRNRTSPFAFTGNKFEFRMMPSSRSIATLNTVLNLTVGSILEEFADRLDKSSDVAQEIQNIIKETYINHGRIVFNGDGYSEEWKIESERRGLLNLNNTIDSAKEFITEKSLSLYERYNILTREEIFSRQIIRVESYISSIYTDAKITISMVNTQIMPALIKCFGKMLIVYKDLSEVSVKKYLDGGSTYMEKSLKKLDKLIGDLTEGCENLEKRLAELEKEEATHATGEKYCREIVPLMKKVRDTADILEVTIDKEDWPFPTYVDMLFRA